MFLLLLQALQNNLVTSKYVKDMAAASKDRKKKIDDLNKEINQLKNTINHFESSKQEEIVKVRKEVKAELDELKLKLSDSEAKVAELQAEVDKLKPEVERLQPEVDKLTEEMKDIEAYTTVFARAKTAYEAVILKKNTDDLYKYIDQWLGIGKMSDLGPSPVAGDHPGETGGSRVDDSNKVTEHVADSAGDTGRDGKGDAA